MKCNYNVSRAVTPYQSFSFLRVNWFGGEAKSSVNRDFSVEIFTVAASRTDNVVLTILLKTKSIISLLHVSNNSYLLSG